jgi:hypothetical protein
VTSSLGPACANATGGTVNSRCRQQEARTRGEVLRAGLLAPVQPLEAPVTC